MNVTTAIAPGVISLFWQNNRVSVIWYAAIALVYTFSPYKWKRKPKEEALICLHPLILELRQFSCLLP
jgi:hypothetical protein